MLLRARRRARGGARVQLYNVVVAEKIVRFAKQLLRNVSAASPLNLQ